MGLDKVVTEGRGRRCPFCGSLKTLSGPVEKLENGADAGRKMTCADCKKTWFDIALSDYRDDAAAEIIQATYVVVSDPGAERTIAVAIVRASIDRSKPELGEEKGFLAAVRDSVTEWVKTTELGRAEYERTSHDFNIGDLALSLTDADLDRLLGERGIWNLQIDSVYSDQAGEWMFDDHLVKGA